MAHLDRLPPLPAAHRAGAYLWVRWCVVCLCLCVCLPASHVTIETSTPFPPSLITYPCLNPFLIHMYAYVSVREGRHGVRRHGLHGGDAGVGPEGGGGGGVRPGSAWMCVSMYVSTRYTDVKGRMSSSSPSSRVHDASSVTHVYLLHRTRATGGTRRRERRSCSSTAPRRAAAADGRAFPPSVLPGQGREGIGLLTAGVWTCRQGCILGGKGGCNHENRGCCWEAGKQGPFPPGSLWEFCVYVFWEGSWARLAFSVKTRDQVAVCGQSINK